MLLHEYQDITNILPHEFHYLSDNANSESIVVQLSEGIVMKEDLQRSSLRRHKSCYRSINKSLTINHGPAEISFHPFFIQRPEYGGSAFYDMCPVTPINYY